MISIHNTVFKSYIASGTPPPHRSLAKKNSGPYGDDIVMKVKRPVMAEKDINKTHRRHNEKIQPVSAQLYCSERL